MVREVTRFVILKKKQFSSLNDLKLAVKKELLVDSKTDINTRTTGNWSQV